MNLFNTLTRKVEEFKPVNPPIVTLYACGPTVYDYQHIGNLRTATLMDLTTRTLKALGYEVKTVMNITDVEDKIENSAREKGLKVDDITAKYEKIYMDQLAMLNIKADLYPHASKHINEQIELIKVLEQKGYAYKTDFGVYFDTKKDGDYGKLGNTAKSDNANSRIELTEGKKNVEDFALWKFDLENNRQKTWGSPWGVGFPGWHIECSAMSLKTLSDAFENVATEQHLTPQVREDSLAGLPAGRQVEVDFDPQKFETIDIHVGGSDLMEVHHENEIAQSECATDKKFVNYWLHGGMLNTSNDKMSKSLGNYLTLREVSYRDINPMALRYFYYQAHYRSTLTFSWEALIASQTALQKLSTFADRSEYIATPSKYNKDVYDLYSKKILLELSEDLNAPKAIAILWEVIKDDKIGQSEKQAIVSFGFDVLGLKPIESNQEVTKIPQEIQELIQKREKFRAEKDFVNADKIRSEIEGLGYKLEDVDGKTVVTKA